MKATFAACFLLFFSAMAQGQMQVSYAIPEVTVAADNSLSFQLTDVKSNTTTSEKLMDLREGKSAVWTSTNGITAITATHYGKFITFAAVKPAAKTGQGQFFIFEEMNGMFVGLTLTPIVGSNQALNADAKKMLEISQRVNGGDFAVGVRKIVEDFRQNPRLTMTSYLTKMATRPANAPIPVGERNKIQTVRSLDELLGTPTTQTGVPLRQRAPRKKPRTQQTRRSRTPTAGAPLQLHTEPRPSSGTFIWR